ncbi:MAG TPA: preprotein translocase subunit YajC [Candidatus Acidoferrum sp.]|nr:preprotein translocase subunit YajC [Candidatus Acidoferrum sp.]
MPSTLGNFGSFGIIILTLGIMYFFMIVPQKKKEKAVSEMRADLQIGDRVVTIGGIIGRVVNIKDDAITIETGTEKTRLRIMRWGIQAKESRDAAAQ